MLIETLEFENVVTRGCRIPCSAIPVMMVEMSNNVKMNDGVSLHIEESVAVT